MEVPQDLRCISMPLYIEFDKITKEIRRVMSANDLPPDAAHLSYIEVPIDMPNEIDLSSSVDEVRTAIAMHLIYRTKAAAVVPIVVKPKPLIEEV
jgi:hypothetical protein